MALEAGRGLSATGSVVLGGPLLAGAFRFVALGTVGLHEGGWSFLLLQLSNTRQGDHQLATELAILGTQHDHFISQRDDFFL
jgi:hypothetical protein